jgi:hypothetical protein
VNVTNVVFVLFLHLCLKVGGAEGGGVSIFLGDKNNRSSLQNLYLFIVSFYRSSVISLKITAKCTVSCPRDSRAQRPGRVASWWTLEIFSLYSHQRISKRFIYNDCFFPTRVCYRNVDSSRVLHHCYRFYF